MIHIFFIFVWCFSYMFSIELLWFDGLALLLEKMFLIISLIIFFFYSTHSYRIPFFYLFVPSSPSRSVSFLHLTRPLQMMFCFGLFGQFMFVSFNDFFNSAFRHSFDWLISYVERRINENTKTVKIYSHYVCSSPYIRIKRNIITVIKQNRRKKKKKFLFAQRTQKGKITSVATWGHKLWWRSRFDKYCVCIMVFRNLGQMKISVITFLARDL